MDSEWEDVAVSPVVAVILMVAITVILSAVIGTFVLDLGQGLSKSSGQDIGVRTSDSSNGIEVTVITGTADKLNLLVNGSTVDSISNASPGDRLIGQANPSSTVTVVAIQDGSETVVSTENPLDRSTTATTDTLPTDLVSYWKLNGDANDSAGPYDGVVNGASFVTGHNGQAGGFNANGDHINISRPAPDTWSLAVWVNFGNWSNYDGVWGHGIVDWTGHSILLYQNTNSDEIAGRVVVGGTHYTIVTPESDTSSWHHLVLTYDGENLTMYQNGSVVASNTSMSGMTDSASTTHIGSYTDGTHAFEGEIDGVRLYNRSLNQSEVSDLYNSTK